MIQITRANHIEAHIYACRLAAERDIFPCVGLVVSGGWLWALFGGLLLLPMLIGCSYLIAAFASDAGRIWRIDLRQLTGR